MIKGKALYKACLNKSTKERQLIKFLEESSELNQAIAKYLLNPKSASNMDDIIEELIDTELMVKQLKYIIKLEHSILYTTKKKEKLQKVNKQLND